MPEMDSSHHSWNNEVHFTYSGGQQNNFWGETIKSTSPVFLQMLWERVFFVLFWLGALGPGLKWHSLVF